MSNFRVFLNDFIPWNIPRSQHACAKQVKRRQPLALFQASATHCWILAETCFTKAIFHSLQSHAVKILLQFYRHAALLSPLANTTDWIWINICCPIWKKLKGLRVKKFNCIKLGIWFKYYTNLLKYWAKDVNTTKKAMTSYKLRTDLTLLDFTKKSYYIFTP